MSKRFTESTKWADKWFRTLTTDQKLAWLYLTDNCDIAGVIDLDEGLAEFQIGFDKPFDWLAFVSANPDRIEPMESGKLLLVKFVPFQYGARLGDSGPHRGVKKVLEKHGLTDRYCSDSCIEKVRLPKGLGKTSPSLQDKDKDKDKDQNKARRFTPPTVDQIAEYATQYEADQKEEGKTWPLRNIDPDEIHDHYTANGWRQSSGNAIKNWKCSVRQWGRRDFGTTNGQTSEPVYKDLGGAK